MEITQTPDGVTVVAEDYRWGWDAMTDAVTIDDAAGRRIASGTLQPVVLVVDAVGEPFSAAGRVVHVEVAAGRVEVTWEDVNGDATLSLGLTFEASRLWIDPAQYVDPAVRPIVSMHQFARAGSRPAPSWHHTYLLQPGLSMSPGLSPSLPMELGLDLRSWLGRGSMGTDSVVYQQWGLPAHYFCGINRAADSNASESQRSRLSGAFCCGLAGIPTSDLMFDFRGQAVTPVFSLREDLWGESGGFVELGARLVIAFGADYREAIRAYYESVVDAGIVEVPSPTPAKAEVLAASQYNTWGAQCAVEKVAGRFDQALLERIRSDIAASGVRPGVFVIDDKWEGVYGVLRHDEERFPDFEGFLGRLRTDGLRVGLWAAFLRTNDPATVGLETRHLMRDGSGRPIEKNNEFAREPYYLFDISQDEVAEVVGRQITAFVERYDPDLVKFDFGYELPSLGLARPADPRFAGEMLLKRALDVIVGALRAAKPDIVVMYYNLSPLFIDRIDQIGHDDMYLAVDSYADENNRRGFFSSLLAEIGVPVYGSGGYNWRDMESLWFDSGVLGAVGSLNSFGPDENGDLPTPTVIARYNGLAAIARQASRYRIDPVSPASVSSTAAARSSSWLRVEGDAVVAAALRATDRGSVPGVDHDLDIVITALDDDSLAASARLGLVPFGLGSVTFGGRTPVRVIEHRFDGSAVVADALRIVADQLNPVEWYEVEL